MHYILLDEDNKIIDVVSDVQVRGEKSYYYGDDGWVCVPSSRLKILRPGEDVHFGDDASTVSTIDPPEGVTEAQRLADAETAIATHGQEIDAIITGLEALAGGRRKGRGGGAG